MVRMRYASQILEEIKKSDPDTSISVGFIKKLAKTGVIRTYNTGRCTLICMDDVLSYLEGDQNDTH